jgi:hypothetical protein
MRAGRRPAVEGLEGRRLLSASGTEVKTLPAEMPPALGDPQILPLVLTAPLPDLAPEPASPLPLPGDSKGIEVISSTSWPGADGQIVSPEFTLMSANSAADQVQPPGTPPGIQFASAPLATSRRASPEVTLLPANSATDQVQPPLPPGIQFTSATLSTSGRPRVRFGAVRTPIHTLPFRLPHAFLNMRHALRH